MSLSPFSHSPRSRSVRVGSIVTFLGCAALVLGAVSCESDLRESFYRSLLDARTDGGIDRGWVPDILPESAHDIHEIHEISGGRTWCAFDFSRADWEGFRTNLTRSAVAPMNSIAAPRVSWWPAILTGRIDPDRLRNAGLELFAVARPLNSEVLLFAIDLARTRGYFYRVPR